MVLSHYRRGQLCCGPMAMPVEAREDLDRALTATIGVMQRMKQHSARKAADWDMSVAQVRALCARDPLSMCEPRSAYLDPSNSPRSSTGSKTSGSSSASRCHRSPREAPGDHRQGRAPQRRDHRRGVRGEHRLRGPRRRREATPPPPARQVGREPDQLRSRRRVSGVRCRGRAEAIPSPLPRGRRAAFGDDPRHGRADRHRDRPDEGVSPADVAGSGIRRRVLVAGRPPRRGRDRQTAAAAAVPAPSAVTSPHDLLHGDHVPTALLANGLPVAV